MHSGNIFYPTVTSFSQFVMNQTLKFEPLAILTLLQMMDGSDLHCGAHKIKDSSIVLTFLCKYPKKYDEFTAKIWQWIYG